MVIFFVISIIIGVLLGLLLKLWLILLIILLILLFGLIAYYCLPMPLAYLGWLLVIVLMTLSTYVRTGQDSVNAIQFHDHKKHWAWMAIQSSAHITDHWQSYHAKLFITQQQAYDLPLTLYHYGPDLHLLTPVRRWCLVQFKVIRIPQKYSWLRNKTIIKANIVLLAHSKKGHESVLMALKHWHNRTVQHLWARAGPSNDLSILIALAFGDRAYLSNNSWQVFARTGTAHLLAIAGLHLGVVVGLSLFLIKSLWRRNKWLILCLPLPVLMVWVAAATALLYAAFTGFEIPCQRASLMLLLIAFSYAFKWHITMIQRLLLAFSCIIICFPETLFSMSLWLSFSAVASICYGMSTMNKNASLIYTWCRLSLVVSLAVLPWSLYFFGQYALIGIIANAIAIPWMACYLVPLCLIAIIVGVFSPKLSFLLWHLALKLFHPLWLLLQTISHWPYANIYCHPSLFTMIIYIMSYVYLFAPAAVPGRYWMVIGLLPVLFCAIQFIPLGASVIHHWKIGQISWYSKQTRQYHAVYYKGRGAQSLTQWTLKAIAEHDGLFIDPNHIVLLKAT